MENKTKISSCLCHTIVDWRKQATVKQWIFIIFGAIIVVAVILALCGTFSKTAHKLSQEFYGEEIGYNGLRYKYGEHIYDPETNDVLVDSIQWLFVAEGDSIGILAKNNHRAYINLNTAQLITPLAYDKAWIFSCDRGVMVRQDTVFIFRRDGSIVNQEGFKYARQYEMVFYHNKLIINNDNDLKGMIDTAANWVLPPVYSKIEVEYQHKLYNTKVDEQCVVYDYDLDTILMGNWKRVDVDWSEGIIVTENNGIQHLFDYKGKLIYEVVFKEIEELSYKTTRKDANDNDIYEETECLVYVDYNNKKGLMDKHFHVLTPPLFSSIEAQTKHVFFAQFGDYYDKFGTLIDDHGKPIR